MIRERKKFQYEKNTIKYLCEHSTESEVKEVGTRRNGQHTNFFTAAAACEFFLMTIFFSLLSVFYACIY